MKHFRPFVIFDLETTGTDPAVDRIVQLAFRRIPPFGPTVEGCFFVNPEVPIPPSASAVHGITDERVVGAPTFAEALPWVQAIFADADVVGYNVRAFDLEMLNAEVVRAGSPKLDVEMVDVLVLFRKMIPHTLDGAVRFYLGRPHDGAHHAAADVDATELVLRAMIERHGLDDDIPTLAELSRPEGCENWIDPGGRLVRTADGRIAINFGKKAMGKTLDQVDPGYLDWILSADFSQAVKAPIQEFMDKKREEEEARLGVHEDLPW